MDPEETTEQNNQVDDASASAGTVFAAALGEQSGAEPTIKSDAADPASADAFRLPDEYAKDPAFANFHDIGALCKSYRETKAMVGRKQTGITDDSTPEEVAAFYASLGAKEKPEEYKDIQFSDKVPEVLRSDAVLGKYYAAFAKNHVPVSIAKGLMADVEADLIAEVERGRAAQIEAQNQEIAKLKTDWGESMSENLNKAQAVWKKLRPDWDINTHPLGDNVEVIRLFSDLYGLLGDGSIVQSSGDTASSLAAVDARIKEIQDNKDYWIPGPEQETLKQQMASLIKQKVQIQGR